MNRRIRWSALSDPGAANWSGSAVEIDGFPCPIGPEAEDGYFALVADPPCCGTCLPRDPAARVEVFAPLGAPALGRPVRLAGTLVVLESDPAGWRFQLRDARPAGQGPRTSAGGFTRRAMLGAAPLVCLAACVPAAATPEQEATARQAIAGQATIDMHSHAGNLSGTRRVRENLPFAPLADPMRDGGMAIVCLAIVSDGPTHRLMPDRRIRPFREPDPGELYTFGMQSFARLHALAREQGMTIVTDGSAAATARATAPAAIVAAEGADFLEGRPERVDECYDRWALRHLQLTHYRVNELGDIQTEPPVHGGLTDIGAEVIRRCNARGVLVDVAHGTYALVKRAASVTTKPLVLSHTSLADDPGPHSRLISPDHARVIAETGGVVGLWPPVSRFADQAALAAGMARMVDTIGIDHVGLGTDMQGLTTASVVPDYRALPGLAAALMARGFNRDEVAKLLGGNYLRSFAACCTRT
jgi:membrane dipeptidase